MSCGGGTPTAPTAPPAQTGRLEGRVEAQADWPSAHTRPYLPLASVEATIIEGPAVGMRVMTGDDGVYRFELPAGTARVRLSRAGFGPWESRPVDVHAGATVTMPLTTLNRIPPVGPEWRITVTVTDGRGNPVPGATVVVRDPSNLLLWYGGGTTDATGRITMSTTRLRTGSLYVGASKAAHTDASVVVACCDREYAVALRLI